ncbi:MAG: hypothetical protein NTX15_06845 [Candidatus Kapabacteria bacterium]|nr:hypothetical protein [Candidatus Kapabacteria bacterium]
MSPLINRIAYGLLVAISLYFAIVKHDLMSAGSNLGIALIFDPFDQTVKWNDRPAWQRAWLIVHVIAVFGLIGYAMFG